MSGDKSASLQNMSSVGNKSEDGATTPVLLEGDQTQRQKQNSSPINQLMGTPTEKKFHREGIFGEMATHSISSMEEEENDGGDALVPRRSPEHLSPHHIFHHQLPSIKVQGGSSCSSVQEFDLEDVTLPEEELMAQQAGVIIFLLVNKHCM